jgi:hypothetical protein
MAAVSSLYPHRQQRKTHRGECCAPGCLERSRSGSPYCAAHRDRLIPWKRPRR